MPLAFDLHGCGTVLLHSSFNEKHVFAFNLVFLLDMFMEIMNEFMVLFENGYSLRLGLLFQCFLLKITWCCIEFGVLFSM